ncbi:cupin domain-containing protein [bacterium LRH843]|nr:cupin domain-containing protein [bacterium LRH843]
MSKMSLDEFFEYSEDRFTKRTISTAGKNSIFVLNFSPKQFLPPHKHPGAHVNILIIKGEGTFKVEGEEIKVKTNDILHFSKDKEIAFLNDGQENASLYVVLTKIE